MKNRTRSCIGPFFGGKDCNGPRNDSDVCGDNPCPGNNALCHFVIHVAKLVEIKT